jgi:2-keto-4-pentenoate hydratase/2-oxohepta-3-ene-1,7-dioic acid hydratase in catechol pathway/MFS family permease
MKLIRFGEPGREKPGAIDPWGVRRDLSGEVEDWAGPALAPPVLARMRGMDITRFPSVDREARLGPPIGGTRKIVCIGLNYADHAAETGAKVPAEPVIFLKACEPTGPDDDVPLPRGSVKTDWEVELGVVIGRRAAYVGAADAMDYVAGYCVANDLSDRQWQIDGSGTWDKGKGCDGFGPLGPWLVTCDEIPDPHALGIWLSVNGEKAQDSSTDQMVHRIPDLIAQVTRFMSLAPGDVISTGTPPGVEAAALPQGGRRVGAGHRRPGRAASADSRFGLRSAFGGKTSMATDAAARPQSGAGAYAWYALSAMVVVYALNFIDRQILSILAEDIKGDLKLTDAQLGFLYGTAFAIFYTLFGIPLGRLADIWYRGRLMSLGLAVWSAMTTLSGFSSSYAQLAIARVGVGVGEASASPAAFSMLADYFPKERRALAAAIYSAGLYVGAGLSLPVGGAITDAWNAAFPAGTAPLGLAGWQATFLAVGVPGLIVAVWVWTLREPARHGPAGEVLPAAQPGALMSFLREFAAILPPFTLFSAARIGGLRVNLVAGAGIALAAWGMVALTGDAPQWIAYGLGCYAVVSWVQSLHHADRPTWKLIWGTPEVLLCILGMGGLATVTYGFGFWAPPYAIRTFGASPHEVGLWLGIPSAIASAVGVIIGGRLSDVWKRRDPRGRIWVCMLSSATTAPMLVFMFTRTDFTSYAMLNPVVAMLSAGWVGSTVAAYQDFVLPRMNGTVSATYVLGSTMVGLAIGPYASGKVATLTGSLQTGVFSLLVMPPITLLCLWLVARRMAAREGDKLERAIAAGEPASY